MLHSLDSSSLDAVLRRLSLEDLAACACVDKKLHSLISKRDDLWAATCESIFGLSDGAVITKSFELLFPNMRIREACGRVYGICKRYGTYGIRSIRLWSSIKRWLASEVEKPGGASTAQKLLDSIHGQGTPEEHMDRIEQALGTELPDALRAIYAVCGGQRAEKRREWTFMKDPNTGRLREDAPREDCCGGLLGGYIVYNHMTSLSFLPLDDSLSLCSDNMAKSLFRDEEGEWKRLLIGLSQVGGKLLWIDLDTEQLQYQSRYGAPIDTVSYFHAKARHQVFQKDNYGVKSIDYMDTIRIGESPHDSLAIPYDPDIEARLAPELGFEVRAYSPCMHWFESFARLVESDMLGWDVERSTRMSHFWDHSVLQRLSLFPIRGPLCHEQITNGIKVKCSVVLMPEQCEIHDEKGDDVYLAFTYRISFSLLSMEEQIQLYGPEFRSLESVMLVSRYWRIMHEDKVTEVKGDGVVGFTPRLDAGGEEFDYASVCGIKSFSGVMKGEFKFREISPTGTGRSFAIPCPDIPLQIPKVIH